MSAEARALRAFALRSTAGLEATILCHGATLMRLRVPDARGRLGLEDAPYPQRQRLAAALNLVLAVDANAAAAQAVERGAAGPAIGDAVRRAREQALTATL